MMPRELLPQKLSALARSLETPVPPTTLAVILCALIAGREMALRPDPTLCTALTLRRKIGIFSIRRMAPEHK